MRRRSGGAGSGTHGAAVCGELAMPAPANLHALRADAEVGALRDVRCLRQRAGLAQHAGGGAGGHQKAKTESRGDGIPGGWAVCGPTRRAAGALQGVAQEYLESGGGTGLRGAERRCAGRSVPQGAGQCKPTARGNGDRGAQGGTVRQRNLRGVRSVSQRGTGGGARGVGGVAGGRDAAIDRRGEDVRGDRADSRAATGDGGQYGAVCPR